MPHQDAEQPKPLRSGVARLLFWMGLALAAIGVLMGLVFVVVGLVTGESEMLLGGPILALVFGGGGTLMHLGGRHQWVRLYPDAIVWRTAFSRPTRVPWRDVHHVEVPSVPSQGRQVRLALFNGRRIPVSAITMSSGSSGGSASWADAGYLSAGADIINAHKAWLALR